MFIAALHLDLLVSNSQKEVEIRGLNAGVVDRDKQKGLSGSEQPLHDLGYAIRLVLVLLPRSAPSALPKLYTLGS